MICRPFFDTDHSVELLIDSKTMRVRESFVGGECGIIWVIILELVIVLCVNVQKYAQYLNKHRPRLSQLAIQTMESILIDNMPAYICQIELCDQITQANFISQFTKFDQNYGQVLISILETSKQRCHVAIVTIRALLSPKRNLVRFGHVLASWAIFIASVAYLNKQEVKLLFIDNYSYTCDKLFHQVDKILEKYNEKKLKDLDEDQMSQTVHACATMVIMLCISQILQQLNSNGDRKIFIDTIIGSNVLYVCLKQYSCTMFTNNLTSQRIVLGILGDIMNYCIQYKEELRQHSMKLQLHLIEDTDMLQILVSAINDAHKMNKKPTISTPLDHFSHLVTLSSVITKLFQFVWVMKIFENSANLHFDQIVAIVKREQISARSHCKLAAKRIESVFNRYLTIDLRVFLNCLNKYQLTWENNTSPRNAKTSLVESGICKYGGSIRDLIQSPSRRCLFTLTPREHVNFENVNPKLESIVCGCCMFCGCCSVIKELPYPLIYYGFDWFGKHIGNFGIFKYFVFGIDGFIVKPKNRECIRIVRTSMLRFAEKIEQSNKHRNYSDGLFCKHLILATLGFYSFIHMNLSKLQFPSSEICVQNTYKKLLDYLRKFVMQPIQPSMKGLEKDFGFDVTQEPPVNTLWGELQGIIGVCKSFLTDEFEFDAYPFNRYDVYYGILEYVYSLTASQCLNVSLQGIVISMFQELMCDNLETIDGCGYTQNENRDVCDYQHKQWLKHVIDPTTRSNKLYIKWKNVTTLRMCDICKRNSKRLLKCKHCRKKLYCSRKCQKIDWNLNNHKRKCTL